MRQVARNGLNPGTLIITHVDNFLILLLTET